jgi:hypothetical protein
VNSILSSILVWKGKSFVERFGILEQDSTTEEPELSGLEKNKACKED